VQCDDNRDNKICEGENTLLIKFLKVLMVRHGSFIASLNVYSL